MPSAENTVTGVDQLRRGWRANLRLASTPLGLTFGASGSIQLLNVLTGVLIAQILGPEGRGELTAALLWPSILVTVGSLGISDAATYHAARSTSPPSTLAGGTLLLALAQSVVLISVALLVLPVALGRYSQATLDAAYLFLAFIPFSLYSVYTGAILNGCHRFRQFNFIRVLVIATTAVGLVALAAADVFTIRNAVIVYVVANVVTAITGAALVIHSAREVPSFSADSIRQLFSFGIRSHGSNVSTALNERLDQLLVSIFLAPVSLGLYVIAVTLTSVTNLIGYSMSLVALPAIARLPCNQERVKAVRRYVTITVAATAAVTVPLAAIAPTLIGAVFGEGFRPASDVARVLLVAAIIFAMSRVLGAALKALNRPLDASLAELVALVVTFASLAALLPLFGILGAGIASLLAYAAGAAYMAHKLMRALDVSLLELAGRTRGDAGDASVTGTR